MLGERGETARIRLAEVRWDLDASWESCKVASEKDLLPAWLRQSLSQVASCKSQSQCQSASRRAAMNMRGGQGLQNAHQPGAGGKTSSGL